MPNSDNASTGSLADWLRSVTDDALTDLLHARRDLATPPPTSSTVLATRAGTPGSIARACEDLDTVTLAVYEAMLVVHADADPTSRDRLVELAGLEPADIDAALDRLRARALAWGDDEAIRVPPAARDVFGAHPAGLGNPAPDLPDFDLDELSDAERALLTTLAPGPPVGRTRDAGIHVPLSSARTPAQKLLARGLLVRRDSETVELPLQIGLALRGGHIHAPGTLAPPRLDTHPHAPATVDETAAGEAMEFIRHTEALLTLWSGQPPPVLKAGGLGVRELRRLTRELDVDEPRAVLIAELVVGAGLVADDQNTTPEWVPTTLTDSWLASTPDARWTLLAQTWLDLPRLPGLAGHRDAKDKPIAPLADELRRPLAPVARRRTLAALADLPPGTGVHSADDLTATLAWRAPRRGGRLRDEMVRWTMAEAAAIGAIALGAVTTATRALLDDDRPRAGQAMADAMPDPVDKVLVQADLTVVAPGPLEPELATEILAVADVESAGHATVYRITEHTVRRALDTGRTAAELHALFSQRSATPVPQALTYLIDDVARRHGRLRGGVAGSFLRCDDESLLAEVVRTPAATELELRQIAPTVLVSPLPLADVLDTLRDAGFAPAAEGPDGRIMDLTRARGRRTPARSRTAPRPAPDQATVDPGQLRAIVAHIRAGDRAATTRKGTTVRLPSGGGGADTALTLALLSQATREQREVWIGFVDAHGTARQRVVTPARVGGGVLESTENERYPLHRITSVALVEDA
ncbi:helicase-associated domain-containing protein [Amycolatopsis suaedae]|uniref:DNA-binding protein n=1 Tax=Amycolatopsis suaedae TaxID=2510978 RepID=A0A4Q7J714_9PSEU|nr:helicase-associated domain-containing protein [Amycolatopsis suaedae]RZQ61804.1 DNA-binding protein [Amycolatopsis suaedae]